jgi:hypothetical protein
MTSIKSSKESSAGTHMISFEHDDAVTLLVGPARHMLLAHGSLISHRSDFFKAAPKKEWVEGQTRKIKLSEEDPATVFSTSTMPTPAKFRPTSTTQVTWSNLLGTRNKLTCFLRNCTFWVSACSTTLFELLSLRRSSVFQV